MSKKLSEMPDEAESKIILYTTDDGKSQVSLMSRDGRVWLNQKQMAELFAVSKPNISMLISKIFAEKELDDSVVKCCLTTAGDGKDHRLDSLKNDTMAGSENKGEGEKRLQKKLQKRAN